MVLGGMKRLADTQEVISAGKFKVYHVIISVLMLATLIAVLPIRQAMYEKKVKQNAEKAAETSEPQGGAEETPQPNP